MNVRCPESLEHPSRNIYRDNMIYNELTIGNVSVSMMKVGRKEDEYSVSQGAMEPQLHHSAPAYILAIDKKRNTDCILYA